MFELWQFEKISPTENVVQLSLVNNLKNLLEYKQTKSISLVKMNFHQWKNLGTPLPPQDFFDSFFWHLNEGKSPKNTNFQLITDDW